MDEKEVGYRKGMGPVQVAAAASHFPLFLCVLLVWHYRVVRLRVLKLNAAI
ncbi:uncharacterized protein G2W53_031052 [Senna tora]|uniref:Uncharacterized protein n=1 Tax=Senna tora TaxID=362788 RepID=A0A834WDJ8_9FABA|nr:uncharacterized protein G2W53_031052 [Senna tora]